MQDAGASIIGVGSALTGMTTTDIKDYFMVLASPEPSVANTAESKIRYDLDMAFKPVTLIENQTVCDDIVLLTFAEDFIKSSQVNLCFFGSRA